MSPKYARAKIAIAREKREADLPPCPFCGSEVELSPLFDSGIYIVRCARFGCVQVSADEADGNEPWADAVVRWLRVAQA